MAFGRRAEPEPDEVAGIKLPGGQVAPDPMTLEEVLEVKGKMERAIEASRTVAAITDQATANEAADALKALKHVRTDAEDVRKKLGGAYADAKAAVDAVCKEMKAPIEGAEQGIKAQLIKWQKDEQARVDAERKAEAERAAKAQAEENAKAEAEQRMSHHVPPAVTPPAPKGGRGISGAKASASERLTYDITDEAALPDEYLTKTPNRSKILADVRAGIPIPGVTPRKVDDVRVT